MMKKNILAILMAGMMLVTILSAINVSAQRGTYVSMLEPIDDDGDDGDDDPTLVERIGDQLSILTVIQSCMIRSGYDNIGAAANQMGAPLGALLRQGGLLSELEAYDQPSESAMRVQLNILADIQSDMFNENVGMIDAANQMEDPLIELFDILENVESYDDDNDSNNNGLNEVAVVAELTLR